MKARNSKIEQKNLEAKEAQVEELSEEQLAAVSGGSVRIRS
ncbi:MAG: bacteriocin [Oscillatoria sp. Prado101]|jgi:bacteriocin-like protein|nr:bacteriocin [Oscillatoria sp. Prado101]